MREAERDLVVKSVASLLIVWEFFPCEVKAGMMELRKYFHKVLCG